MIKEVEGKWVIFIAKGLTIQQVYDALPFSKWKYAEGDLDEAVPINDRISNKDYVVYVDKNVEADEQFKNKSANDLKKTNHTGITLMERLILGLKHFEKEGKHLDINNVTLCFGSRYSGVGVGVPRVDWSGSKLLIHLSRMFDSGKKLRSRKVLVVKGVKPWGGYLADE